MNRRSTVIVTGLAGLSLVVTATAPSFAATKKTTKKATTKAASTTAAPATTKAASGGSQYGKVSDTVYQGKGGFKLDLSKCPKDWNANQGISNSEIKLFTSMPRSGPLAGFGLIADGMKSYFDYINSQGGVGGLKISLDVKDDGYDPAKTRANVTEAIASGKYAAFDAILGTSNGLAVWDDTNKECMPQLGNATGAAQWGDVDGHPWATGVLLDYTSEASIWADWVKEQFPSGAKVAGLVMNNDFGSSYSKGFKAAIKGSKISYTEEKHDPTAPNVTNQMTNIDGGLPDVILIETTGAFCTQALAEIEKRGLKSKVMLNTTCNSLSQYFAPLKALGLSGNGTYMVQTNKEVNDKEFASDPAVQLFHKVTKSQGLDDTQSTYAIGWVFAIQMVDILKEAATYNGGINRANIMLAARGVSTNNSLALNGITTKMNGMEDAYYIEGGRIVRFKAADKQSKDIGTWFPQGPVVNKEGTVGTYKKFNSVGG